MVQKGQFLERPAVIRVSDDLVIEGLYHRGEKVPLLAAPPHPLMGGSMDAPALNEIAFACYRLNHPSLRFNYRGVGASQGEPSGNLADAVEDLSAALDFLLESTGAPRAVVGGYSFGALAAGTLAAGGDPRVHSVLLVTPPVARFDCGFVRKIVRPGLVVANQDDGFGPPGEVQRLLEGMENFKLEVIPRADHFFSRGLADLGRIAREWLAELE